MPRIETGGAKIYNEEFVTEAAGATMPLVMVPGLGAHSRIWGPFPRKFAEGRRVITFDPRGLGRSKAPDGELSLELMASDLKAVVDAAGVEKAAFLGASMGALVVLRFALDYPDAVSKLVLVTPAVMRTRYNQRLFETLLILQESVTPEDYMHAMTSFAFAPPFFERGFGMIVEVGRMLTPTKREYEQVGRQLKCLKDVDISSELSGIDIPSLIVAGERDVLAPIEGVRTLASKLRGSRLFTLPNVGHSPFVEATEEIIGVINEFL